MKPELQIKAIAELDGIKTDNTGCWLTPDGSGVMPSTLNYLTSRDAIVPVIEKTLNHQPSLRALFCMALRKIIGQEKDPFPEDFIDLLCATPSQLSEALLRATGKWKD